VDDSLLLVSLLLISVVSGFFVHSFFSGVLEFLLSCSKKTLSDLNSNSKFVDLPVVFG